MIILTDNPNETPWPGADTGLWKSLKKVELSPQFHRLWEVMGGGNECFVRDHPGFFGDDFWDALVWVRESNASQFDLLQREHAGIPGRTACIAMKGKNFHGLRQRPWTALAGNLHFSCFIRTATPATSFGLGLTMLPAVAAVSAIEKSSTQVPSPGIKWVNDILCEGKKVAGVLSASEVVGNRVSAIFFGIGMNLAVAPQVNPTPFVPTTGCLSEWDWTFNEGPKVVLPILMSELSHTFHRLLQEGVEPLLECYRKHSCVVGREVHIWNEGLTSVEGVPPVCTGRVQGINADLSLNIEGVSVPVTKGRLSFVDPYQKLPCADPKEKKVFEETEY